MLRVKNLRNDLIGPIDLEVEGGACVALTGASGAGKTVLLRAIVDLDPNAGDVSWNAQSRSAMPAPEWRRLVSFVPAETGWWADQVSAHFRSHDDVVDLMAEVGLSREALDWDVARLSTGERHRLGLARALAFKPQVLLLDEPTAALDAEATEKVEALLQAELASGAAILLVTHDPQQARRLASRTLTIESGRLSTATGPTR